MKLEGEQTLLRVYLRNTHQYHLTSAADALVQRGRAQGLLPVLDEVVSEGLITLEAVRVLKYRHNPAQARP